MERLLLWDIDGTLLSSGGVSRDVFYEVAEEILGRPVTADGLAFDGRTDPEIARQLFALSGVPNDEIDRVVKQALRKFGPAFGRRAPEMRTRGGVLPGVREVLTHLDDRAVLNTLLTGNLAVNAMAKLQTFRLAHHFEVELGGYGSDAEDRLDLVDVVLDRLRAKNVRTFADDEIWIIGDTPRDLAVARENDVRCLLVATGRHSVDDLAPLGPDALLDDLSDLPAFLVAVGL